MPRSDLGRFRRSGCLRLAVRGFWLARDAPYRLAHALRIGAFDAFHCAALDGDALHIASLREIVVDRVVLGRAVVPNDQRVRRPVVTELIFWDLCLQEQDVE